MCLQPFTTDPLSINRIKETVLQFSRNSKADASVCLENNKEMFPWYYMYSGVCKS